MGLFSKKESKPDSKVNIPPPMPSLGSSPVASAQIPNVEELPETGHLASPPVPVSSITDIKSQISSHKEIDEETLEKSNNSGLTNLEEEDSLFDLSEFESENPFGSSDSKEEHEEMDKNAHFMRNRSLHSHTSDKTYYITTAEFKKLLEIVESVKTKVKDSSERHLRLLDIKAEEDIEYENLKRDFEFVEDKLYEVDSLIFEK